MSDKPLSDRLQVKSRRSFLLVNPPPGYIDSLGELPHGAVVLSESREPVDIIQLFVKNRQELEKLLPPYKTVVKPRGMIWVTYYKGTASIKTDINRDSINVYAGTLGLTGVAMISVDSDWSALRLKLSE